jgi:hypothetical protein
MMSPMRTLAVAGLLLALSCRHPDAGRPPATAAHRPSTASECQACNGVWGVHGLRKVESCLCRTHDAGKTCKDAGECEGECLAEEGRTEVTDPGPPPRGYFLGRCSEYDHVFGCEKRLEAGTRTAGPRPLDQVPPTMCVD